MIGNLTPSQAHSVLQQPARSEGAEWEPEALHLATQLTGTYPFFLQELGYAVWPAASGQLITAHDVRDTAGLYRERLDTSIFRVRLDRATELEKAYLRAMAQLGPNPASAADVARLLGRSSQQAAPTRAALIDKGLLYSPGHGLAAFTVPTSTNSCAAPSRN